MIHPWIFSSSSSFIRTQLLIHLYTFFLDNYLLTSIRLTNLFNLWTFPTFFTNICHKKIYANTVFNGMCTIFDLTDCSLPASSVHRILQARLLEWVAISFSRVSSQPRNQIQVPYIAGRFFTNWATREAPQLLHRGTNIESNFTSYTLVSFSFSYGMSLSAIRVKWFLWMYLVVYLVVWREALHF